MEYNQGEISDREIFERMLKRAGINVCFPDEGILPMSKIPNLDELMGVPREVKDHDALGMETDTDYFDLPAVPVIYLDGLLHGVREQRTFEPVMHSRHPTLGQVGAIIPYEVERRKFQLVYFISPEIPHDITLTEFSGLIDEGFQ
jgi:hypothetical protein